MCGIVGIWNIQHPDSSIENDINRMADSIKHRGPDSGDSWVELNKGIAFGHRRLAIIELSNAGQQPMHSSCNRYTIVFNGEIYNHLELRAMLQKNGFDVNWKGESDTETLLECIKNCGIQNTLDLLIGMFAFAVFDNLENSLILARDRFGEKPLYYGYINKNFVFASELKAIKSLPYFDGNISLKAIQLQSQFSYIPDPFSIYEEIAKLVPGSFVKIFKHDLKDCKIGAPHIYWSATNTACFSLNNKLEFSSDQDAINQLDNLLSKSVKRQMMSDVPLGAFLSGGIDSSLVVSLMQKQSTQPVKTFTIGFNERGYDEAKHAKNVAKHLGTNHTELYVTANDSIKLVEQLGVIYDEPFADASQIPSILVSKLAKTVVTVSLSGDGGDELFGGYSRYFLTNRMWGIVSKMPMQLRRILSSMLYGLTANQWNRLYRILSLNTSDALIGDKIFKAAKALSATDGQELYFLLVSHLDPHKSLKNTYNVDNLFSTWMKDGEIVDQMMLFDSISYLPGDILTKMDRAGMSVSLETRIPFLDHNIFEFAWKLPQQYKIRNGQGKWILREVLYKYVPKELVNRPKMGFSVPVGDWIRGPLLDWACDLLDESRIENQGIYNTEYVKSIWSEHLSKRKNWDYELWNILMFQQWLNSNKV
jgi:asparagine synthase (glutamine-hydrolysing)